MPKEKADSLWNRWQNKTLSDSARMVALHKYAWSGYMFSQPDSAFYFGKMEYEFAEEKGLKRQMANGLNTMGVSHYVRSEYQKALDYYYRALEIRKEINLSVGVSRTLNNIAGVYLGLGNYAKAIEIYSRALKIQEDIGDQYGIAVCLGNIGTIYYNQGDYDKALGYFEKSLKIDLEIKDTAGVASARHNIGIINTERQEYENALIHLHHALEGFRAVNDAKGVGNALTNIGNAYFLKGEQEKAMEYFQMAYDQHKKLGNKQGEAAALNMIGLNYKARGDTASKAGNSGKARSYYQKALEYSQKSYQIALDIDGLKVQEEASKILYQCHKFLGNFSKALDYFHAHVTASDSIKSEKNQREVIRQEYKYEYEKKAYADSVRQAEEKKVAQAKIQAQKAKLKQEETQRYALYGGVGLLLMFGGFMFNRFRVTKKQKDIISKQKAEVEIQKSEAEHQKQLVEEKNTEILDSINYAKRLQEAILPPQQLVKQWLEQSFILYQPKDIVAGDFYWMETVGDTVFFAAADCTGHGVPGAMVSVVCSNALSKAVIEEGITDPGKILDRTRELVIERFGRSEEEIKDGMDIALCSLHTHTQTLHYSGAHNPLWIIRKDAKEVKEIEADKQPIGHYATSDPFTTHKVRLNEGDSVCIFSDGFSDQFGGEKGKKYKSGRFKRFLLSVQDKDMEEQKQLISEEFNHWKGNLEQLDDVCIVGVRI